MGTAELRRPAQLAVDIGVSTVKMAWLDGAKIVDSSELQNDFPAAVAIRDGRLLVGHEALALRGDDPAAVLLDVREWLGYLPSLNLSGMDVPVSAALSALYQQAARESVGTEPPPSTILVHPTAWSDRRVGMLADAAGASGLDVVRVVPDAVGVAAIGPRDGYVLVIDVGASLTVTVLDSGAREPQIVWSRTSSYAGGEAIAQAIRTVADVPVDRARQLATGAALQTSEIPLDWVAVRRQASGGVAVARALVIDVLRSADRDGSEIAHVYISGAASHAPFVRDAVNALFGADKVHELSGPAASAAHGALRMCTPARTNVWASAKHETHARPAASPDPTPPDPPDPSNHAPGPTTAFTPNAWRPAAAPSGPAPPAGDATAPGVDPSSTPSSTDALNAWTSVAPAQQSTWQGRSAQSASAGATSAPTRPLPATDRDRHRRVRWPIVVVVLVAALLLVAFLVARATGTMGLGQERPSAPLTAVSAAGYGRPVG